MFTCYQHRHSEVDFDIPRVGEIRLTADDNMGDLLLGRVRQKYILDPDLRGILSRTVLDADKMIPYQDQELLLITSVVYSEKFEVVGERKLEVCTLSLASFWIPFRVCFDFLSSGCFMLKWMASSRVGG